LNPFEILPQYSKFWKKLQFQNFDTNENMGVYSICNFSTNVFGGQGNSPGRRRDIAESFADTLGKILEKFHQNRNTNCNWIFDSGSGI